ncbi:hypothetical protein RQP46_001488 [Phenoliferia psychrophenolica]
MPNSGLEPLEIELESSDLVLRGFTGEELEPAVLNGELILNLAEATNLKEIQLTFNGTAKVTWRDSSTHHHDHPLFFHDFNFLNPTAGVPAGSKAAHAHVHTLKAGRHVFPFSLHIPGHLPASLRTYSGTCVVEYKLKAHAVRSGFGADWKARKIVKIARGFGVDAVEYNQTLEIENTWPGKVMYAFTIPHKAYAAGDTIPVSVKFSPLAKGVQIASLITTIREHTTVHSKSSSHSEARDATVVKYNFVADSASVPTSGTASPIHPPSRIDSAPSLTTLGNGGSVPTTPGFGTVQHGHTNGDATASGSGSGWPFGRQSTGSAGEGEEDERVETGPEADIELDTEVDVVVDVPIPAWTAPTHTVHPVFINHKIKWSAFIKNPDGHVSELRCALPIHILAPSLAEEARLASAGSRNLLFGDSGVLAHSDVPQVDLPSYQDHVMDRVADAATASYFSLSSGFTPTPWSCRTPGGGTPAAGTPAFGSPHNSPPPSRPSSPGPHRALSSFSLAGLNMNSMAANPHSNASSRLASRRSSGSTTPITTPASPAGGGVMIDDEHPEDHRNWIDSELLSSLNLDHTSPPGSNPTSRPGSRPGSRPNSRPASPDHSRESDHSPSSVSFTETPHPPPLLSRSSTSGSGFFHLHIPKPLRPLTAFSRNGSSSSLMNLGRSDHAHHPSASALSTALEAHAAKSGPSSSAHSYSHSHSNSQSHSPLETITHSAVSNSPIATSAAASPLSSSPTSTLHGPTHPSSSSTAPLSAPGSHSGSGANSPSAIPPTPHANGNGDEAVDFLSQVPSYDVAARGFLGGGVVPLSMSSRLPNYED